MKEGDQFTLTASKCNNQSAASDLVLTEATKAAKNASLLNATNMKACDNLKASRDARGNGYLGQAIDFINGTTALSPQVVQSEQSFWHGRAS